MPNKTLLELESGDCRYPLECDEDGLQLFCCEKIVAGRSYCPHHLALSILPPPRRPAKILEPAEPTWTTIWAELNSVD